MTARDNIEFPRPADPHKSRYRLGPFAAAMAISLIVVAPLLAAEKPPQKISAKVKVDPRVELFSVIFRLAGNREYSQGRVESYTNDVDSHFGKFRDHAVVKMARCLRQSKGVGYDAPMWLAVHLTDIETLETQVPLDPWPESLDRRWNKQSVEEFLKAARQFVRDTSFRDFFEKHRPLYKTAESRLQAILDKEAHLEWFDAFFGQRPAASFAVVLGMLNGGSCYGPRCRTADGTEELYCVLGVWLTDAKGAPRFESSLVPTVIHEFCHSYANGFIYRHQAELHAAGEKLYAPVASAMQAQAYRGGTTVLCESLVRACVVRHTLKYAGEKAANTQIEYEANCSFRWVGALSKLLGEYESHRDQYATLEAYSRPLIKFFVEYADKFAKEEKALDLLRPKIVSITPASGDQNVDPNLKSIRVVFDRPMRDKSWSLVGGGPHCPEAAGPCSYDANRTTWSCPIKLKPDWSYTFMLNARPTFMGFLSREGVPLEPVTVSFKTTKQAAKTEVRGK